MKKVISMILMLMLVFSMTSTAFAATITVNGVKDETYNAYKIFDVIWEDNDNDGVQDVEDGYGYSIKTSSEWYSLVAEYAAVPEKALVLTETSPAGTYTVTVGAGFDAADFANHLLGTNKINLAGKTVSGTALAGEGGVATLNVASAGYYLVDTTLGSLCILDTAASTITVKEKNSDVPLIEKEVKEDSTGQFGYSNDAEINETIEFKATITVKYNTKNYVLHDAMDAGLTFTGVTAVKKGSTPATEGTDYTVKTTGLCDEGCDFEVVFTDAYIESVGVDGEIEVYYTAVLNENAVIDGAGNKNLAWVETNKNTSEPDETITYTYKFDLVKTDKAGNLLTGAEFKLYDAATGGNEIKLVKESEGVYRVAKTGETTVDTIVVPATGVAIKGLDKEAYYLEETKAPEGYNPLTGRQKVDLVSAGGSIDLIENALADNKYDEGDGGVRVINNTGSALPETGATGTILFVTFGTIVVLAAGVLLVTKKRMSNIQ